MNSRAYKFADAKPEPLSVPQPRGGDLEFGLPLRPAAQISTQFFLETALVLADLFDGDLLLGTVFMAIADANLRHIDPVEAVAHARASGDAPHPDRDRRPQSVYQIAKQLGLPYETARRHVKKLVAEGYCERSREGFMVTEAAMARPVVTRAMARNLANFNKLLGRVSQIAAANARPTVV